MTYKVPLTPSEFQQIAEGQLRNPSLITQGDDLKTTAKIRAGHYAEGAELLKQISDTLTQLAAQQSNPEIKAQADLALNRINEAQNAFSNASLCQQVIYQTRDQPGNPKEIPVNLKSI